MYSDRLFQFIGPGPLGFETRYFYPTDAYGESRFGDFLHDTDEKDSPKRYYNNDPNHSPSLVHAAKKDPIACVLRLGLTTYCVWQSGRGICYSRDE